MKCEYCDEPIDELPRACRYCKHYFCSHHRQPELHDCKGLKKGNIFRFEKASEDTHTHPKPYTKTYEREERRIPKQSYIKNHEGRYNKTPGQYARDYVGVSSRPAEKRTEERTKTTGYFHDKLFELKHWAMRRERTGSYERNSISGSILLLALIICLVIIYTKVEELNKIVLWALPLGAILFAINVLFIIWVLWASLKRIARWYEQERNWVRYLIFALFMILLIMGFLNGGWIAANIVGHMNEINVTKIFPINRSNEMIKNSENLSEKMARALSEAVTPKRISEKTAAIEQAIFKYTNKERLSQGKNLLTWDRDLANIARNHSLDMARNNYFSHTNLQGQGPTARAILYGYDVHKGLGGGWFSDGIAENIDEMPTGDVIGIGYVSDDPDSIAKAEVEAWMGSEGHRANILNNQYDRLGVGCAYDGEYYICTQDFI